MLSISIYWVTAEEGQSVGPWRNPFKILFTDGTIRTISNQNNFTNILQQERLIDLHGKTFPNRIRIHNLCLRIKNMTSSVNFRHINLLSFDFSGAKKIEILLLIYWNWNGTELNLIGYSLLFGGSFWICNNIS